MLWMLVLLFVALVAAGLVVLYVTYPHRGAQMPLVPGLGERMKSAVDSFPTLDEDRVREALRR